MIGMAARIHSDAGSGMRTLAGRIASRSMESLVVREQFEMAVNTANRKTRDLGRRKFLLQRFWVFRKKALESWIRLERCELGDIRNLFAIFDSLFQSLSQVYNGAVICARLCVQLR